MPSKFIIIAIVFLVIELLILGYRAIQFTWKHFICRELDLADRYGRGSYAVITGASSGQGRIFATELAKRGFNLILIGSRRTQGTHELISKQYPSCDVIVIEKNFARSYETDFFDDIKKVVDTKDVSILVNNVGQRVGWIPYHKCPAGHINDSIATGTFVQARLVHMLIGKMAARGNKSAIINITAQCQHTTFGLGHLTETAISVPYLSVYEAANAFGYYHANSIFKEYGGGSIDLLNITPGAVLTENTGCLSTTPFAVSAETFVGNCIRLMGNWQGTTCAYWGHELSGFLINFAPWIKSPMLRRVGETLSRGYMTMKPKVY